MTPIPSATRIELATGLECAFLEWQADSDHTVILVHGFLDMAHGWVATVRAGLAGRFHVVAPDMRGHGDSDRVGAGGYYHFLDYIADLASLIDEVGRKRVSLVGHSMGGSIASYYTGAFPERVHKLALLEGLGPPEMNDDMPSRLRLWIEGWKKMRHRDGKVYESVRAAADRLRAHDSLLGEELALELATHGTREAFGGYEFKHDPIHLTRGPYPFQVDLARELWAAIACPVLVVDGAESKFKLAEQDNLDRLAALADSELRTLPGAGHMMQRHQPEALAGLLLEFLG